MKTHPLLSRARRSARAGFSLAELMVVIVIIGLLSAIVVPNLLERFGFAQTSTAKVDIKALETALTEYSIRNGGQFPDSLEALVTPDENGNTYLNSRVLPKDPWGNEYNYEPPFPGEPRPRVFSYGKDGAPGGTGDAKDLDNWGEQE
ncbi:MAG: type II secretion system major pseudopilin GspG [Planctomycetes bacterium]|nr:type II secretion system major pseudopilin GspG [Planctomycetota bacterium]MCB9905225.1 type II secretion system major pseudopilin GspG [Planctomycetota bacterium]